MMLVDSHCHLDFPDFAKDFGDVMARASSANIGTMLTIGTTLSKFSTVRAIAEAHEHVYCSVGVHPHEAGREGVASPAPLLELANHPKVVGIGETGLDYFYEHSARDAQKTSFVAHIEAARESKLPLIVHARDADEDAMAIMEAEYRNGAYPGVIHCFTASRSFAERALALGFCISFSGIVTFRNAKDIQDTARAVPLDRILVETDAPYLAPVPNRGKRNEPSFVSHTARFLAELKGISADALARDTTDNFFNLFRKAKRPAATATA
ncbi:MAG: TatD family hydrolase [Alphaproteobacteria bacterium]